MNAGSRYKLSQLSKLIETRENYIFNYQLFLGSLFRHITYTTSKENLKQIVSLGGMQAAFIRSSYSVSFNFICHYFRGVNSNRYRIYKEFASFHGKTFQLRYSLNYTFPASVWLRQTMTITFKTLLNMANMVKDMQVIQPENIAPYASL